MRQTFFVFFFGSLFALPAFAQQGVIKGSLIDTIAKQPVGSATISLLRKQDSSLVSFTMADEKGRFELTGIGYGDYRLMVTHVNYHGTARTFRLDDKVPQLDLGVIPMNDITKVLDEVTVTNNAPPVTLVGDTVQYNAGSFKVQPNASVEDLLKKFPGIKVDRDGTIKAQGEKVTRVLVDGKEFFGNDPKIATKNLPADVVDKVQVYNKQSDQSLLTGFDDGNSEKTLNLKLKKDKKKGYFGKVNAGAGTDERYQGRFNISSFKGARQMSAIGTANNTNTEGFSFMDILNFTGELGRMMKGGGGNMNINLSQNDPLSSTAGMGNNTGINTIWGSGLNYNNVIGTKTDFTSNYFYNRYNPNAESHIQRQYILPDSSYFYDQNSLSERINNNHRLNLSVDYQFDSLTSLKISPSFSYQKTNNKTTSDYTTLSGSLLKNNEGTSNNLAANEGYNLYTDILFRRKFRRKGRTFSVSLQSTLNDSHGEGNLNAINGFYDRAGSMIRQDTINQQNSNKNSLNGYTARIVYTEPLFRRSLLEFSAGKSSTKSVTEKITRDYNRITGKFDDINSLLTNDYQNRYSYTNAGIRLRRQSKKYNYALGLTAQKAELEGKIFSANKDSVMGKAFTNLLPNARFQYYFSRFRNLQVNYSTYTNQPTAAQLQPVADNTDPLNIKEGNPDLKQEYTQALQTNLFMVNPYTNKNLFASFSLQQTQRKIVNDDRIDSFGIKTTKPVNVNGTYNLSGDITHSFPLHGWKANLSIGSTMSYYKSKQFINTVENNINSISVGPSLRLDINASEKLQISLSSEVNYNHSGYSLQPALNSTYFSQRYQSEFDWQLPGKLFASTEFIYTVNSQRAAGFNTRVPLWNAAISRPALKFNRGEIKLSVNDLLNKNIGISRNANQNYIEDSRIITLRRFFLLSFTYSLNKTGLTRENSGGKLQIISR